MSICAAHCWCVRCSRSTSRMNLILIQRQQNGSRLLMSLRAEGVDLRRIADPPASRWSRHSVTSKAFISVYADYNAAARVCQHLCTPRRDSKKGKGACPFLFPVFGSMPVGHEALGHVGQHRVIAELVDVDAVTAAAIRVESAVSLRRCVVTSINP